MSKFIDDAAPDWSFDLFKASELVAALANPWRFHLLKALAEGERNVRSLRNGLGISQAAFSQHLQVLCRCGIIHARRDGTSLYYSIKDEAAVKLIRVMDDMLPAPRRDRKPLALKPRARPASVRSTLK